MTKVIVDDNQMRWVADSDELIAVLDSDGWEPAIRLGLRARIEPPSDDDDDPYTRLCRRVTALADEPSEGMPCFAWYPAEGAWIWT